MKLLVILLLLLASPLLFAEPEIPDINDIEIPTNDLEGDTNQDGSLNTCLLYTSPSPRDRG